MIIISCLLWGAKGHISSRAKCLSPSGRFLLLKCSLTNSRPYTMYDSLSLINKVLFVKKMNDVLCHQEKENRQKEIERDRERKRNRL